MEAGLFAYAKGLAHWQRETRYCAHCGAPLQLVASGHRAQCTNADCGRMHFPRTDAAVIMLVEHDGACLLGRQAGWPVGRYSTLAGFVEPGEALEDAVRREVAEEAGVVVDEVRYHSSQPWPMPASLMIGFPPRRYHARSIAATTSSRMPAGSRPSRSWRASMTARFYPRWRCRFPISCWPGWLQQTAGIDLNALVADAPTR